MDSLDEKRHDPYNSPECEIIFEAGGDSKPTRDKLKILHDNCEKNRGHPNFYRVSEFDLEHLPEDLRNDKFLRFIKRKCEVTVRIAVKYTSTERPDKCEHGFPYPWSEYKGSKTHVRFGTGVVLPFFKPCSRIREKCPCPMCKNPNTSNEPKLQYWKLYVKTATHVICDNSEAECSDFDCFLDTDFGAKYKRLYGVGIDEITCTPGSRFGTDSCYCVCITHDEGVVDRLSKAFGFTVENIFKDLLMHHPTKEVMVSHPHGCGKRITVGDMLYVTTPIEHYTTNTLLKFCDDTVCRLPLKPWAPDGLHSQDWAEEDILKPLLESAFTRVYDIQQKVSPKDIYYLRYTKTKSDNVESITEKVYHILLGNVYDIYKFTLENDMVRCVLMLVRMMYSITTDLVVKRCHNIKRSPTKNIELIDIGLLLFRYYLILTSSLLDKHIDAEKETQFFDTRSIILQVFFNNIFCFFHEISPLFDVKQFLINKCEEFKIQDREYPDPRGAEIECVKILSGDDVDVEMDIPHGSTSPSCANNHESDVGPVCGSGRGGDGGGGDDGGGSGGCGGGGGDDYDYEDLDDRGLEVVELFIQMYPVYFLSYSERFQHLEKTRHLVLGEFLQPGTEFKLTRNIYFMLPPEAEFAYRFYKGKPGTYVFPPGTKFIILDLDMNMYLDLPIPREAEFMSEGLFYRNDHYFITHEIASCPGSSGASIYSKNLDNSLFIHNGAYGGKNRSCVFKLNKNIKNFEELDNHIHDLHARRYPALPQCVNSPQDALEKSVFLRDIYNPGSTGEPQGAAP